MSAHAKLSPSGADRWMLCPGSVSACEGLPDTSSKYADEGTAAHYLAAHLLNGNTGIDATAVPFIWVDEGECRFISSALGRDARSIFCVKDLLPDVMKYFDRTADLIKDALFAEIEVELPIAHLTGEKGATGTSDAVIIYTDELVVADLKYGMGNLVDAENNRQLMIYALAAVEEYGMLFDFERVRLIIDQPRLNHVSEWVISLDDLLDFGEEVKAAALATKQEVTELVPGEKQCKWCKTKANCKALADHIQETVGCDFEDLTVDAVAVNVEDADVESLGAKLAKVDLIEGWCKAVRAAVESKLLAGDEVPGFKLVQGKKGNRAWRDPIEAEALLKKMRVKHDLMYEYKLISPTTADKLAKVGDIGPRNWPRVAELIVQAEGKPSVAPISDPRPALEIAKPSADDFDEVVDGVVDGSDLI